MSAISLVQNRETTGLVDAVGCWVETEELLKFVDHLERASARMMLDQLDVVMPPGKDRQVIRNRVLDVLEWYKREMLRWLESESRSTETISGTGKSVTVQFDYHLKTQNPLP